MPSSRRTPAPPRTPAGGINPSPTTNGGAAAIAAVPPPHVGADSISARFTPRADMESAPTRFLAPETCEFPGWCGTYRTTVGRDALIPPDPCGAANTRGRDKSLPCEPESILRPNGKRQPHDTTYLCRGRCLHRPAGPCAAAIPRFARNIKFIRKNETKPSRLQPTPRRKSPGLCTGRGIWLFCPVSGYSAASSCAASSPRICSSRIFLMFSSMWKLLSSGIYRISSVMLTGSQKLVTTSTSGESG